MGRVLVFAGAFNDELDAVACGVRFKGGRDGGPDVRSGVWDILGDCEDRYDVGGGPAEELQGDTVCENIVRIVVWAGRGLSGERCFAIYRQYQGSR